MGKAPGQGVMESGGEAFLKVKGFNQLKKQF
jgi:hypothetical protein